MFHLQLAKQELDHHHELVDEISVPNASVRTSGREEVEELMI
jgi:hypothetical protein